MRAGRDPADTNPANRTVDGMVIKGVGVGGDVDATITFFPDLLSTKNLNILDCVANPATGNASLADLDIAQSDGPDSGTAVDPWVVSIPSESIPSSRTGTPPGPDRAHLRVGPIRVSTRPRSERSPRSAWVRRQDLVGFGTLRAYFSGWALTPRVVVRQDPS